MGSASWRYHNWCAALLQRLDERLLSHRIQRCQLQHRELHIWEGLWTCGLTQVKALCWWILRGLGTNVQQNILLRKTFYLGRGLEILKKTSSSGKKMYRCRIKGQGDLNSIDLASDELSKSINVVISKINDS